MDESRTTTGQRMSIGYDPAANTLIFREEGWYADPFRSSSAPTVTRLQRPIGRATITRLRDVRRRTQARIAG
jgi:hypothetical protein